MREFNIFLGFVFEGAFKLGFLEERRLWCTNKEVLDSSALQHASKKEGERTLPLSKEDATPMRWSESKKFMHQRQKRIQDYESFVDGVFERIKEAAQEDEILSNIVEDIRGSFPYDISNPPQNMRELERLKEDYEGEMEEGIKPNRKELYTKLIFSLGYAEGKFYSRAVGDVKLKKYHMGEESEEIIWQNADMVFVKEGCLYILDFKLGGARNALREIITGDPTIPIHTYGIPVNISLGEMEFKGFLEKFMKVKDKLRETEDVFVETKGLLQTLCYAVDFLCTQEEPIKEVNLELIYPVHEPLHLRFFVKDRKGLEEFLEPMRRLYKDVKEKESPYAQADTESQVRKRRLKEELPKKIKEIREEINKREREEVKLPTGDIKEAREDVKRLLEAFFKKEEPCKAIALLHSAGSGKTSNLREMILKQEGKHIVLYMATRLSLLDREYEKLKERKDKNLSLVYVSGQKEYGSVIDTGIHFESEEGKKEGKLKSTVEEILNKIKENNPDYIWAFLTIQAIVETARGKKTSEHLRNLLRPTILKDYHIHIVLDEFFGYKNGLFAITEMFEFLKEVKQRRGRASLYMFDANGYSPNLLEKLIVEYKEFEVIPESIVLAQYQEEIKTHYEGIPFEIYAKHGYPAKALLIHKKFFEVKKEEEMPSLVANYIKKTLKEGSTAFAFIQNKELIVEIERELSNLGLTSLIATASSKKSQEQINKGEEDVILGTSSVSRGLDFSRPHKPVDYIYIVVNAWGIENNLVETIQAISRSRGDEKTEEREKHIHLIYLINDQYLDWVVDKISSTLDHPDKELVELVYKKEQLEGFLDLDDVLTMILEQFLHKPSRNVLVPVPTQQRSQYRPNTFKEYEEVVSFLEDVHYMERGEDLYKFLKELTKWGYIYTSLPQNLENTKDFKYYHPYILYEEKALHFHFDNDIRRKLEPYLNKLKSVLKKHNPEKAKKVEDFVKNTIPTGGITSPLLLPIYSFVFVKNYLKKDQKLSFRISKRVGRGHADVLGGGLEPKTLCAAKEEEEYACIPLGEDYPYKEVLSGRFAKFPVKFIKSLLEG